MLQLIYISVSSAPITPALIERICIQSRKHNLEDEITGVLVTKGERFLQALEGPKTTVEDTFMRLVVDQRHTNVVVISRRMTTKREFGEWEMRHCGHGDYCDDALAKVHLIVEKASDASRSALADFLG